MRRPSRPWPIGTETIEPVDVVVGPGNRYVAEAKRQVSGTVGVASAFAGPSEVVVVADATTPTDLCAIDLLVQAEHGPDGLAWLVTWSEEKAAAVDEAVARLVAESPRRADLEATLAAGGYAVVVDGPEQAAAVIDVVAPEHLELLIDAVDRRGACRRGVIGRRHLRGPVVTGQRWRLPGWPQPRPAHQPDGPVLECPPGRRFPTPQPCRDRRTPRPRGARAPRRGPGRGRRATGPRRVGPAPMGPLGPEAGDLGALPTVRPDLVALSGYHSAQVDVEVRLNTNESPLPPPAAWYDAAAAGLSEIALQPLPGP